MPIPQNGGDAWKAEVHGRFRKRCETSSRENGEEKKVVWLPEVYFASDTTSIIQPHTWAIDLDRTHSCGRTQIPLKLGWALTMYVPFLPCDCVIVLMSPV